MLCACAIFYVVTNSTNLRKKILNITCVFWISLKLLSQTFLILRTIRRDMVTKVHSFSCNIPVIIVRCYSNFNLLDIFSKKSSNIEFRRHTPKTSIYTCTKLDESIKEASQWVFYSSGLQTEKRKPPIYENQKSVIIFIYTWCLTFVKSKTRF
jgi:hypothetical protein